MIEKIGGRDEERPGDTEGTSTLRRFYEAKMRLPCFRRAKSMVEGVCVRQQVSHFLQRAVCVLEAAVACSAARCVCAVRHALVLAF